MKVAKFGGSSLANATQIKKVAAIIQDNPDFKAVIVSAPGKRDKSDIKVTDLLIALYEEQIHNRDVNPAIEAVIHRYQTIADELHLSTHLIQHFENTLRTYLSQIRGRERLLDAIKACGEDFNAQLISDYLNHLGVKTHYINPMEAGIRVTDEPSNARLLDESYAEIAKLKERDGLLLIPGFFGYSLNDEIVTFSRGGSDISGAIIARGLGADVYENYTDETYIFAAHPGKIDNPHAVKEVTYLEMRELAYAGFGIFHDEALEPVYKAKIPVMIRNTNDPKVEGTKIVDKRELDPRYPVTGISSDTGFISISISKYLLNREVGFTRRLLQIFGDLNILIEHVPTGIDDITVIIRKRYIESPEKLDIIIETIQDQLAPERITVEDHLVLLVIVGEGMASTVGIAAKASQALADANVNIRMIMQGASEISMVYAIQAKDEQKALKSLYHTYFTTNS